MNFIAALKPKKLALVLSAILTATTYSANAENLAIVVNDSTPAENREFTITGDTTLDYISVLDDATIRVSDNVTLTGIGIYEQDGNSNTAFTRLGLLEAGTLELGKGVTINYAPTSVKYTSFTGLRLQGTSKTTAEDLTMVMGEMGEASPDAITLDGDASLTLKGTTTIRNGALRTLGDAVLNVENLNLIRSPSSSETAHSGDLGLIIHGQEANFTGNVNIQIDKAENSVVGIMASDAFNFLGKTRINITNTPDANAAIHGTYLLDTHATIPDPAPAGPGKRYFEDLEINIDNQSAGGITSGLLYTGIAEGNSDMTVEKLTVNLIGTRSVRGIYLWDYVNEGSSKTVINNANIQLKGDENTKLTGLFSTNITRDLATQWDANTTIGNITIHTEGGKNAYLLENADARFTGDVILGSQLSYDSVTETLYSIYGAWAGTTDITNNNKLVAWGKMLAKGSHAINIVSGDNSYIYGDTQTEANGTINLALNGSNSRWDMVADSNLTNLTLDNSTLNFMPAAQTRGLTRAASTFKTLTVNGDYAGNNGNIVMNTQLGDDASPTDKLVVQGNTSGTTNVKVVNAGGAGGLTTDGIELITVAGNSDGEFKQNGRIVAGAYDYTLARGEGTNDKNWYLSSALSPEPPGEPANQVDPTDPVQAPRESAIRPEAGLYGMNLQAANTLFNTRLQDRLGETHYVDALTGEKAVTSLWLRNVGGHTRQKDSSGQLEMQANRYVMQLGGDIAQWSSDNADRFHLGLMAGYANQKARAENQRNGKRASSDISGYSVGLYGTWLQDNETHEGAYVDTWAQYSWFDNSVNGRGVDEATKEYDSRGFTASVESGYTWKLADISERNALYIQPKAQVTWMGVKADEHKEANGTRVEGKGDGNIQTRLGVRLYGQGHNQLDDGKNRTFQPFVEANWIHNTKDFGVALNGENVDLTGTRNIGELKAGVEGQLTKNVALWGNVAQQVGDKGYSDTSAMLGVKVAF
ncbi:autotransporter outer membrane beta-barrel domain-containing protein [Citrobacter sp. RHB25-C09]|uniref:autotransporter outer membrane beta-barrel domain-containing protein n=1 Tax=Citrobacter sp. RHB25-C09 TaxID=2742624 RepID=UPI0015EEEF73|nr:autotransporter outer membrane beta-barrel domain-containing protein [Citrobacter sp. RHB25-C09]QMI04235.1 autotransporter outer membrane beta-barrel domain-containing protein [Citrobacter sp. RHB25-C09]